MHLARVQNIMSGMHTTKRAAQEAGDKFYVSTHPCRKCGQTGRRYTSSSNCVECAIALQTKRWDQANDGRTPKKAIRKALAAAPEDAEFIFTGIPCNKGHVSKRYNRRGYPCFECEQARNSGRRQAPGPKKNARAARKAALAAGEKTYEGQPCPHGHGATKYAKSGACVECARLQNARSSKENAVRNRKYAKLYRQKNAHKIREKIAKWYQNNPGAMRRQARERQLATSRAIPQWANKKAVAEIYDTAVQRSKREGISYHVDHIVPLRHKLVCGLHCEDNLQILTAKENMEKHNSTWPDMP